MRDCVVDENNDDAVCAELVEGESNANISVALIRANLKMLVFAHTHTDTLRSQESACVRF